MQTIWFSYIPQMLPAIANGYYFSPRQALKHKAVSTGNSSPGPCITHEHCFIVLTAIQYSHLHCESSIVRKRWTFRNPVMLFPPIQSNLENREAMICWSTHPFAKRISRDKGRPAQAKNTSLHGYHQTQEPVDTICLHSIPLSRDCYAQAPFMPEPVPRSQLRQSRFVFLTPR